jgi:hypothetical protein
VRWGYAYRVSAQRPEDRREQDESYAEFFDRAAPFQTRALRDLGHFDGRPEAYEAALAREAALRARGDATQQSDAQSRPDPADDAERSKD